MSKRKAKFHKGQVVFDKRAKEYVRVLFVYDGGLRLTIAGCRYRTHLEVRRLTVRERGDMP